MCKSIVLLSGGLDSLTTAAIASRDSQEIYFLHANYAQRTMKKEKDCFEAMCKHYAPTDTLNVDIDYLAKIGGSSLTDTSMDIPQELAEGVPSTYVPFRNAHLLCIAVSWGEVIGAQNIYIGAVEEDSSGYPDCREVFYQAFQKSIDYGTKDATKINIKTPLIHMSKAEIIKLALGLNAPLQLSWSCYQSEQQACGICDSCRLRISAFKKANYIDPIEYAIDIDW